MSKLSKCPFCGQELTYFGRDSWYGEVGDCYKHPQSETIKCPISSLIFPKDLWNTRPLESALQSALTTAEQRLSVAVKLDADDKDGFDWKVLDRIHDLDLQLTAAQEENKRLQDAYRTIEFISKYDGKDNNRRSTREEFIFIKVKAMDCIDRIKKSQSALNGGKNG